MKARTIAGRGEEGPLCDPGSEFLLGASVRYSARILNGMEKKNEMDSESSGYVGFCVR